MSLPMDFLQSASRTSLEDFELASMERAAKHVKQLKGLLEQWVSERVAAEVARILIENEGLRSITFNPLQEAFDFPDGGVGCPPTKAAPMKRVAVNEAAD